MPNTRKPVRYYIDVDRDADTPVVRSVPVAHPTQSTSSQPSLEAVQQQRHVDLAMLHAAEGSRRRSARLRLIDLAKASIRREEPS